MWLSLLPLLCVASPEPELRIEPIEDGIRVRVIARWPEGVPDSKQTTNRLTLRLVNEEGELGPPILGTCQTEGKQWVYTPRYRLASNQSYQATLELSPTKRLTRRYRTPQQKASPPPIVERVYPTTDQLPANHLKFYIFFSRPMREGREIFDQIELRDENDQSVREAWRRTELWTDDARRLTLWIHPGRIKTGVNLREDEGPVLEAGHEYSLVIKAGLKDSQGRSLKKPFIKKFQVQDDDRKRPLPLDWKITTPSAGTRECVKLDFGEPLDYALLFKFLEIRDSQGKPVPGKIVIGKKESSWKFYPKSPWQSKTFQIQVDGLLEDLAGNTPLRLFDTDLVQPPTHEGERTLNFQPK